MPQTAERLRRVMRSLEECGWLSPSARRGSPLEYVERLLWFARERACQSGAPAHDDIQVGPSLEELFELLSNSVLEAQALGELEPSMPADSIARSALVELVSDIALCNEELVPRPSARPAIGTPRF